MSQGFSAIIRK